MGILVRNSADCTNSQLITNSLGEDYWEWIEQLGTAFDLHIFTFKPENIKVHLYYVELVPL